MYIRFIELEKKVIEFIAIGLLAAVAGVSTAITSTMPKFSAETAPSLRANEIGVAISNNTGNAFLRATADRAVRATVNAGVNTAIAGVDFNKSLKLAAINEATSAVFEAVGDFAATKGMADGSVGKVALHAGVGAGVAKLMGADPLIGALAAGTAEGLSSHIDNAGDKDSRVKTAGVIGAVTAFAAGGDAKTINAAASLAESARANNRELHPKEQQVLKYALANAKTDEERARLKLAAQSMVHSSEGVPDSDKHKSMLVASDAAGSLYAAEQAKLKATAQGIFGYSDAFEYSGAHKLDDGLSQNFDQTFTRVGGGVDLVVGSFGAAALTVAGAGSMATSSWNPYAVPGAVLAGGLAISSNEHAAHGAKNLLGTYESKVGANVLRSFEEGSGSSYTGRLAVSAATDAAIMGVGYGIGKALPALEIGVTKAISGSRSAGGASVSNTVASAEGAAIVKTTELARPSESSHYSVVYEAQLVKNRDFPGQPDKVHFREANRQLYEHAVTDIDFVKSLETEYPGIIKAISPIESGTYPARPPTNQGLTWHHNPHKEGSMELMPRSHHTAPGAVQKTLHPGNKGGMKIWGGGRK